MIARTWYGTVPIDKARAYVELLRTVGCGDYRSVKGNLGAWALQRTDGDVARVGLVSFWDSRDSLKGYTSEDIDAPQYTDFDPDYLVDLNTVVTHHEVDYARAWQRNATIARIWHGAVPIAKYNRYLELMRTVALFDYTSIPGNYGAFTLHRKDGDLAHFTMLTFWESMDAVKEFAGEDASVAKYYDFDRAYLIELEPTVLHFSLSS